MNRFLHSKKGFTLIEMLVVIALLGGLAAIAIPNAARFIGKGNTESLATELSMIQTAMDSMMTDNNLSAVTLTAGDQTNDMTTFPVDSSGRTRDDTVKPGDGTEWALAPDYTRKDTSKGYYKVALDGTVTQFAAP